MSLKWLLWVLQYVVKFLDRNKIEAIKEDMKKDEALKFVRDTAIERRNLTD